MRPYLPILLALIFGLYTPETFSQKAEFQSPTIPSGIKYFTIETENNPQLISLLQRVVSIDKVEANQVFAHANTHEFDLFLKLGIPWQEAKKAINPSFRPRMLDEVNIREIESWDFYPTYDAYLDMMAQFATNYPKLCDTLTIGYSEEGRKLMMVKISDNVSIREAEPQFLYTGTMHGDELVGFVLLLRLADYLLNNYGTDPEITALVNNTEIWINPLANPDGTYYGGNHTVWTSIRYNANNVNLNRNYPDPDDGPHPDGNAWQAETLAFMQLAEEEHFVMSANLHSGAEVINYPWDTWQHLTADNDWWYFVCREYADTVHEYAPTYYLDGFDDGVTNGYDWYTISGGRQDYMNYYHHCREVTMELSNTKKLAESQLENHWDWNYRSMLNYIKQCHYGVSGMVTDENTGKPIAAKVYIDGHDEDNSWVYADENGFYQRMADDGIYNITFSADGYVPVTIQNVAVQKYTTTPINVTLNSGELDALFSASDTEVPIGGTVDFNDQSSGNPSAWQWSFEGGTPDTSALPSPAGITYSSAGSFDVSLTVKNKSGETSTLVMDDFIRVHNTYNMTNETITIFDALFYDSGGKDEAYQNNEDYVMTFLPAISNAMVNVTFMEFSVEEQSVCSYDWLKIYDGNSTSAALIGTFCGTGLSESYTATNPAGALTFEFHSDVSVTEPGWKAQLSCHGQQTLQLDEGWSGISIFLEPSGSDVENLLAPLGETLEILVGNNGIFWPSAGINTLGNWDKTQGYIIKMNNNAALDFTGTYTHPNSLSLDSGWNYLPVLTNMPVLVEDFENDLSGALVLIKEIAGTHTYWPEMEIYTLLNLQPGKAFLVYLNTPANFTFQDFE